MDGEEGQLPGKEQSLFDMVIFKGTELFQESQKSREKGHLWKWCFPLLDMVRNRLKDHVSGMWLYLGAI